MASRRRKRRRSRTSWPPLELPQLDQRQWDVVGLGLVAFAAFFACVFYFDWAGGEVGEAMADGILYLFGGAGYLAPIALFATGAAIVIRPMLPAVHPFKTGALCLVAALTLGLAAGSLGLGPGDTPRDGFFDAPYLREHGGLVGESLFWSSAKLFSEAGSHILFVFLLLAGILLITGASIAGVVQATRDAATTTSQRVRRTTRPAATMPLPPLPGDPIPGVVEPPEPEDQEPVVRATHVEAPALDASERYPDMYDEDEPPEPEPEEEVWEEEEPEPEPVPAVEFHSDGQVLIVGPAAAALDWAERLGGQLEVSVLATDASGELPLERKFPVWSGSVTRLSGWLGAFEVEWRQDNPIDLEVCTRCNACIRACPEEAIDFSYQVDLAKCKSHRACVKACGAIGAIDFSRSHPPRKDTFDLVLDLSRKPLINLPQLPQGYLAPGADPLEQAIAAQQLTAMVGEFEKPRFFQYREKICAHSRSGKTGCNLCLDVCSSGAIQADGDHVRVEPHLCAGCGGCATVCPSGAMTYAYPKAADTGARLKTLLSTYRGAGGKDPCILIHDAEEGRLELLSSGRKGKGLPARVIPLEVFHVASLGIDTLLSAIAYGASQVVVLSTEKVAQGYVAALQKQMRYAQTILTELGYSGKHFSVIDGASAAWELQPAATVSKPAAFNLSPEKRTSLDFAIDHLAKEAKQKKEVIPLPAGAMFGALTVNKQTCTLCKACIGACPESALIDSQEAPALRFIERNCVQCGLCANTCPENAITLVPRLLIGDKAKQPVTLNEAEPFNCVRCAKPFGTRQMVDNMLGKLGGHSMFSGGTRRLQMCGDCRVVDMMENTAEASIHDFKK